MGAETKTKRGKSKNQYNIQLLDLFIKININKGNIDNTNENASNTENIPITNNIDPERKFNVHDRNFIAESTKPTLMYIMIVSNQFILNLEITKYLKMTKILMIIKEYSKKIPY